MSQHQLAFDLADRVKSGPVFVPPAIRRRPSTGYERFLAARAERTAVPDRGRSVDDDEMHASLFGFQREAVRWAAKRGRAGLFADCGLGKSRMQLTWAKAVAARSLIVAPLSVARQTVREAEAIDMDLRYVRDGSAAIGDGVWITNYEMVERFNLSSFGAIVLDESSILKHVDSRTRMALTDAAKTVPLRLACTATPAPNDVTEIVNHADFLGVMQRAAVLATYFVNVGDRDKADYGWRLKGHAHADFYRWMAGWALPIRTPSDLGFPDAGYELPALTIEPEIVECGTTVAELGGVTGRSAMRRRTLGARVDRAVEVVERNPNDQHIVWCGLNDEADAVAGRLGERAVNVEGSWAPDRKAEAFEAFQDGQIPVLVTKVSIAGFGMNFQQSHRMVFCGIGDSWESYFQAIRRQWRFGQQHPVDVSIVVSEAETAIVDNVLRKERQATEMTEQMVLAAKRLRAGSGR